VDVEWALALFEKVEFMLSRINPAAVLLIDDIRAIPNTEELVCQIENFEFQSAAETLAELRKKILIENKLVD
jgi:hypothetical protein